MLILIPTLGYLLIFLGWGSLYLPENLWGALEAAVVISALGCAHPLRTVLRRAKPLSWGARIVVFSLTLAFWFSALAPLLMIANVKLDSSSPRKVDRVVLAVEARGAGTCKVQISDYADRGLPETHWLWLECAEPHDIKPGESHLTYLIKKGGLGFEWVSEVKIN